MRAQRDAISAGVCQGLPVDVCGDVCVCWDVCVCVCVCRGQGNLDGSNNYLAVSSVILRHTALCNPK